MGRILGGSALLLLAGLMAFGFIGADVDASAPATLVAVLVVVVLPAVAGIVLLMRPSGSARRHAQRREELRQQTVEAEVLRLAARRGAKLTVVEVATELAVGTDAAEAALNALAARDVAELEVTQSGVLVYAFRDISLLPEKPRSKGILDD
jgi:hypothetical protein